ncbi:hypothetical protein ACFLRF_06100 [Candidatus Altiarchaeota archaeon]
MAGKIKGIENDGGQVKPVVPPVPIETATDADKLPHVMSADETKKKKKKKSAKKKDMIPKDTNIGSTYGPDGKLIPGKKPPTVERKG